ncbi:type III-B CRISPR module RAMP protein Cmr6 [Amycolatopsis mediterranei]|uniref:type III-B CRISPR module RAMP protein Cmr6 n=1 Tax=Amycolatopsis mediterranei TaxID=33910 RepID=UPI0034163954
MPKKRPAATTTAPRPQQNVLGTSQRLLSPLGRCEVTPGGVLNLTTVLRRLVPEDMLQRVLPKAKPGASAPDKPTEEQPDPVSPGLTWLGTAGSSWLDHALLEAVSARRSRALATCATTWRRWRLSPLPGSTFALDLGDTTSPAEVGSPLHGTYGWPYLPGSALKGLAAHVGSADDPVTATRIFGTTQHLGSVTVLDALPDGPGVTLSRTVLTPHHPKYTADASAPPADWDQPVPISYLTVTGSFLLDMLGPEQDTAQAGAWLERGLDLLGLGGKTTSGHGYGTLTPLHPDSI